MDADPSVEAIMKQFVPIEDEFPLEARQGASRLVPYRPGLACHHAWQPVGVKREAAMANFPVQRRYITLQERAERLLQQEVLPKQNVSR